MTASRQITFRDIPHSEAIKTHIDEKIDKLTQFCDKILSCHVVVEFANKNQHQGNLHNIRITLTVPGKELVSKHNETEDLYVSIRDAFADITRQLESYEEHIRGQVKNHESVVLSGKIARLFNGDGFGFIENGEGEEFYFNAGHVVHPTFEKLTVGMPVHFVEHNGNDGPQAHRIKLIDS
jgi:ribosomal subunit interface protein